VTGKQEVLPGRDMNHVLGKITKGWRCLSKWDRWFAIPFMFVFFALIGWAPEFYVRTTEIPPFDQLQRSTGVIFFESGGRGGWITKLKADQGVLDFSCWAGGRGSGCISAPPGHSLKEWQNRPAKVWWFPRPNPYSRDRFAAQIEIDGVIVKSYQDSVRGLSISKNILPAFSVFYIVFPFAYLGLRMSSCLKKTQTEGGSIK